VNAKKIIGVALLMMVSPLIMATNFTVVNECSSGAIDYNPIWSKKTQGWRVVGKSSELDSSVSDTSSVHKIEGIWWRNTDKHNLYYVANLRDVNIPVARLGVKIKIRDNGVLVVEFDGKQYGVSGQLSRDPGFR
jgi:hypothetical protein